MIRTTANKYGDKKMDTWISSQSSQVGHHERIIKATPTIQKAKEDSVMKGSYSEHLHGSSLLNGSKDRLVETKSYGKPTKLA